MLYWSVTNHIEYLWMLLNSTIKGVFNENKITDRAKKYTRDIFMQIVRKQWLVDQKVLFAVYNSTCKYKDVQVNPLNREISMHILRTALHMFSIIQMRRICLTIKTSFSL